MSPNNKQLINSAQIGKTACMSEIINVKLKDNTLVKLKMYYDSQSQHTLCNQAAKALMTSIRLSKCKIQFEMVMGKDCRKRNICKLKISDEHEIDAILIDNLQISSFFMEKPKEWHKYQNEWSEEIFDTDDSTEPMVLLGADMATFFPINVIKNGLIIETKTARLHRSKLTNKLIAFGHSRNGNHNINTKATSIVQIEDKQGIPTIESDGESEYENVNDLENHITTIIDSQQNDV